MIRLLLFIAGFGMIYALISGAETPSRPVTADLPTFAERPTFVASELSGRSSGSSNGNAYIRDASGRFHLDVEVDGQTIPFLLDTGADMVVISPDTAQRLGFALDPNESEALMETASGTGKGQIVTLRSLSVGGYHLENVEAIVADDIRVNLLGQTVLRQMGTMTIEGDRLSFR